MKFISFFIFSFINFALTKRAPIELSSVASTLDFFFSKVHSLMGNKMNFSNEYFNITIMSVVILTDIQTPILIENRKQIRYDNVTMTYSFFMKMKEKEDDLDILAVTRSDCIAVLKYDNILFTLNEDNELTFIANKNEDHFEIADLDLFRLELFKDKITKKDSSFEQLFDTIANELVYNISTIYPECDQIYYFKLLLTELIQYGYFSVQDIKTNIQMMRFVNVTSYEIKNKEFYNINITLWLETVDESTIIPIIIEHFILKKRGFEIVGDIRVEGSFPIESARVKNALYYCIYIVHKTLDWE